MHPGVPGDGEVGGSMARFGSRRPCHDRLRLWLWLALLACVSPAFAFPSPSNIDTISDKVMTCMVEALSGALSEATPRAPSDHCLRLLREDKRIAGLLHHEGTRKDGEEEEKKASSEEHSKPQEDDQTKRSEHGHDQKTAMEQSLKSISGGHHRSKVDDDEDSSTKVGGEEDDSSMNGKQGDQATAHGEGRRDDDDDNDDDDDDDVDDAPDTDDDEDDDTKQESAPKRGTVHSAGSSTRSASHEAGMGMKESAMDGKSSKHSTGHVDSSHGDEEHNHDKADNDDDDDNDDGDDDGDDNDDDEDREANASEGIEPQRAVSSAGQFRPREASEAVRQATEDVERQLMKMKPHDEDDDAAEDIRRKLDLDREAEGGDDDVDENDDAGGQALDKRMAESPSDERTTQFDSAEQRQRAGKMIARAVARFRSGLHVSSEASHRSPEEQHRDGDDDDDADEDDDEEEGEAKQGSDGEKMSGRSSRHEDDVSSEGIAERDELEGMQMELEKIAHKLLQLKRRG